MNRGEPIAGLVLALTLAFLPTDAAAQRVDRVDRRSKEMALPDEYLDPSWPDDDAAKRILPKDSDSVEEVPLDEEEPDAAEAEEAKRLEEALNIADQPDEMRQNQMGGTPEQPEPDDEEARDPAQW